MAASISYQLTYQIYCDSDLLTVLYEPIPSRFEPVRGIMPTGVSGGGGVAADVAIAVEAISPSSQQRIGAGELAQRRVVIPRAVIVQSRARIRPLPGVAVVGGQRAIGIAHPAIGRVELTSGNNTRAVERLHHAALVVSGKVAEGSVN